MRSLKMGRAAYWRVKPTCASCGKWGRDHRCHCHGTGIFLECRICDREVRQAYEADGSSVKAFAISAGPEIHYDVCSEKCRDHAIEEIVAMDLEIERRVA